MKATSEIAGREGVCCFGGQDILSAAGESPDGDTAGGGLASTVAYTILSYGMFLT